MAKTKEKAAKAVQPAEDVPEVPDVPSERTIVDTLLELLLPTVMLAHLFIAPYTKVEESFNIQAIHDVANIGMPVPFTNVAEILAQYDHFEFPGVVPRSFAAASFIGGLGSVILGFIKDGPLQQTIVRALIGLFNCSMMILLARRAAKVYTRGTARWYLVLQASQFHVMYYASRTLPNMMAFGLVTYALAELLPPPRSLAARKEWFNTAPIGLQVLIVAAVIFRSELAILFFTSLVPLIANGWVSIFPELIILGGATSLVAIATTVGIDTFFWQTFPKPMWAELEGFIFNTVDGKSAEWGTNAFHYYFTNSIPKLMLNPMALLVLLPLGIMAGGWKRTTERLVGPSIGFVAAYSFLPHKEWRFIVYVVPALTLVAGAGADWVFTQRKKTIVHSLTNLALFTTVALSFVTAFGMSYVSSFNYPGGEALKAFEEIAGDRENLRIHMDTRTCMTGATRFTQNNVQHPGWKFSKEERKEKMATPTFWAPLDYVFSSTPGYVIEFFPGWEIKKSILGYDGFMFWKQGRDWVDDVDVFIGGDELAKNTIKFTGGYWPVIKMTHQVWILGRKGPKKMAGFDDVNLNGGKKKGSHGEL
ncbi:hypothetical protein ABW20_dc0103716 [Dactylellina cionopaga]|nr:hypothetical protein ABW20_dc0103716 [Dactylellina cionopaga]